MRRREIQQFGSLIGSQSHLELKEEEKRMDSIIRDGHFPKNKKSNQRSINPETMDFEETIHEMNSGPVVQEFQQDSRE